MPSRSCNSGDCASRFILQSLGFKINCLIRAGIFGILLYNHSVKRTNAQFARGMCRGVDRGIVFFVNKALYVVRL